MREYTTKLYEYNELSEQAKQKALATFADINVIYMWWHHIYNEAEESGFKIVNFDIDRGICTIEPIQEWYEIASRIKENVKESTDLYNLAVNFIGDHDQIIDSTSKDENGDFEDEYTDVDKPMDELEEQFKLDLQKEHISILRKEYEYLTSRESIEETIRANEYEFTEDGKFWPYN